MTPISIPARFDDFARGYIAQLDTAVMAAVNAWQKGGLGPDRFRDLAKMARETGNHFRAAHYESLAMMWERDPRIPVAYDLLGTTARHGRDGATHHFLTVYVNLVEGAAA